MARRSRRGMTPDRAIRAAKVVELYDAGTKFADIARALNISQTQARKDYDRAMEEAIPDTARLVFDKNDRRLNRLYRRFLKDALEGDVRAGRLCLDILREQSELWGVKGAIKVEFDGSLEVAQAIKQEFATLEEMDLQDLLDEQDEVDGEF